MDARFNVVGTFHLQGKSLFVLYGDIVEGQVRPGNVDSCAVQSMDAPIHSVEFVDGPKANSCIALAVPVQDLQELELWEGLNIGGEELIVVEAGGKAT